MRKSYLIGALVGALALVFAAVSFAVPAAQTTLSITAKASPSKAGTKKKPKAVRFTLTIKGGPAGPGLQPATSTAIITQLPSTWKLNSKKWPKSKRCDFNLANNSKTDSVCPKGSKVGSGSSQALAANGGLTQNLAVRAYVIKNGNVGFFIQGSKPVAVAQMLEGKVSGRKLNVVIPSSVQEPVPGVATGITLLKVSFKGSAKVGKKKIGILETTGCKGRKWTFKVTNRYRDGSKSATDSVKCKK